MGDLSLFKRSSASKSARSGFTIVEVLTVVSVFGILVTAILTSRFMPSQKMSQFKNRPDNSKSFKRHRFSQSIPVASVKTTPHFSS